MKVFVIKKIRGQQFKVRIMEIAGQMWCVVKIKEELRKKATRKEKERKLRLGISL